MTGKRGINPEQRTWTEIICNSGNYELKFVRGAEVGLLEELLKKEKQLNDKRVSEVEVIQYNILPSGQWTVGIEKNFRGIKRQSPFEDFVFYSDLVTFSALALFAAKSLS